MYKISEYFLQPFRHLQDRWTNQCIFVGKVHDLDHFLSVGVGILPAGLGPSLIDYTIILCIQKRAWRRLQNVVLVLVDTKIFFNEIAGFHAKEFRDPFNIVLIEDWTCGLAAICTLETINFFEHLFMGAMESIVHDARIFLLQAM